MGWASSGTLIGREAERHTLAGLVERICVGTGGAVLIAGDPGMGKSRLAEEAAISAAGSGVTVVWGRCRESEGAPPLWPWTQILRQLNLPGVRPDGIDPAARFRFFERVTELLRESAAQPGLLIIIDDVHRADELSTRLLGFVTDQLRPAAVGVVATYRERELRGANAAAIDHLAAAQDTQCVQLSGLDEVEVSRWLALDGVTAGHAEVHRRTAGNPLYINEVVRLIRAGRGHEVPPSARELFRTRAAVLPEATMVALEMAAVLGRDFGYAALASALSISPASALDLVGPAVEAGLVVRDPVHSGGYRFAHILTRESWLETIPELRLAELHGRALIALQDNGSGQASDLAHHAVEARVLLGDDKASRYTEAAAEDADRNLAWEDAARWWLATAELQDSADLLVTRDPAGRGPVRMRLGQALLRSGDVEQARAHFESVAQVARVAGDGELLARAALAVGDTVAEVVADRELIRVLDLALEAPSVPVGMTVRLEARRAMAAYWLPEGRIEARRRSAAALAHAHRAGDNRALGAALVARQFTLRGPGHLQERIEVGESAALVAERFGDADLRFQVHQWLIPDRFQQGDLVGVHAELAAAEAISESRKDPFQRWWVTIFRGLLAGFHGRDDEAEALAREVGEWGRRLRQPAADVYECAQLAPVWWRAGRLHELEMGLTELVPLFPGLPTLQCDLVLVLAETGQQSRARSGLRRPVFADFAAFRRDSLYLASLAVMAATAVSLRDEESARPIMAALTPYADRNLIQGAPTAWGSAAWHLARLAELIGDQPAALRYGAQADELHRQWDAGPVGPVKPPAVNDKLALDGKEVLTPREQAVLALLATGLSNKEIADDLTISIHTAERHVANIFVKLGIRNRTEATAWSLQRRIGRGST